MSILTDGEVIAVKGFRWFIVQLIKTMSLLTIMMGMLSPVNIDQHAVLMSDGKIPAVKEVHCRVNPNDREIAAVKGLHAVLTSDGKAIAVKGFYCRVNLLPIPAPLRGRGSPLRE